jgi:hypothetical protein
MNIEELTLKQIREIQAMSAAVVAPQEKQPFVIGKNYLIRTVTMIDTGRIVAVTPQWIVLEDAAWIADTGRFSDAVKSVKFNEVEPFPAGRVIIGAGAVIDAVEISELPRSQK